MIHESWFWKQPLLEMAARLRIFKTAAALSEEQFVQIERDIFIGFYSVRKLFDTITKVTDATKLTKISVIWHPNLKPVTWRTNHRIDDLYDLDTFQSETRDVSFVCGRIIHSFIFAPCIGEGGGLAGIMFTSDTDKNSRLYVMSIDEVIAVFERVGNDDPQHIESRRDPNTGNEDTIVE
jgi:hypothetical protein